MSTSRAIRRAVRIGGMLAALGVVAVIGAPAVLAHRLVGPPPSDWLGYVTAWTFDAPVLFGILVAGYAYGALVRTVNRAHPQTRWPARRTAAFFGGLAVVGFALLSPLDTFSDDLMSVHMVQHFLLLMVGPPLLAAGGIGLLVLRAADHDTRRRVLLPVLHSRMVAVVTFPPVGWVVLTVTIWASHFSSLFDLALSDDGIHAAEHVAYLAAALLFWWPVFSPDPMRWRLSYGARLVYLLSQMPQMTFLSMVIVNAPRLLYPSYAGRPEFFGISALSDQQAGAAIMWVLGDLGFLTAAAIVFAGWMRHEDEETRRGDARLDRAERLAAHGPTSR